MSGLVTGTPISLADLVAQVASQISSTNFAGVSLNAATVGGQQLSALRTNLLSVAQVAHKWVASIDGTGTPQLVQPSFSDLSGTLTAAQLPLPTATTLGGVQSDGGAAHQFVTGISTSGVPTKAQPAFTDISGSVAAAQLPNPAGSTLGGVKSLAAATHQFLTAIGTDGTPTQAQPAFGDLSGAATVAQGGTGLTGGTSGGLVAFTASGALASSVLLPANAIVLGGGSGATPAPLGSLGTTTTVLKGNAAGAPTWGAVNLSSDVTGSLPNASVAGLVASATTDTTNASNIASGTLPAARLPNPSASTLGGVQSIAAVASKWVASISTSGVPTLAQPAAADITGLGGAAILNVGTAGGTVAAGNDTRITGAEQSANRGAASGYAPLDGAARVPLANLPASVVGGVHYLGAWNASGNLPLIASGTAPTGGLSGSYYVVSIAGTPAIDGVSVWSVGDWIVWDGAKWDKVDGQANPVASVAGRQGAVVLSSSDISGLAASATTDTTNAVNVTGGTLPRSVMPAPASSALGGIKSLAASSNLFLTGVDTSGNPTTAQPTFANLSGLATLAQLPLMSGAGQIYVGNVSNVPASVAISGDATLSNTGALTVTKTAFGALTATSLNGLTVSTSSGTLTIANGKVHVVNNALTFAGTDGTSFTFPAGSDTVAGLGTAQTFTANQVFSGTLAIGSGASIGTFTGNLTTPTLTLTGSGTNIGLKIAAKGTGIIQLGRVDIGDNANGQGVFDGTSSLTIHGNNTFSSTVGPTLNVTQALAGAVTSGLAVWNEIGIASDNVDASAVGGAQGFYVGHNFGGANTLGGRTALTAFLNQTAKTANPIANGTFYVAFGGHAVASFNDNGRSGTPNLYASNLFASNVISELKNGATWWNSVVGLEVDVSAQSGSSVNQVVGLQIVRWNNPATGSTGYDAVAGDAGQDNALQFANSPAGASPGWNMLISVGALNGWFPLKAGGTIMGSSLPTIGGGPAYTTALGIDLTGITFTTAFLKSTGFLVDGAGITTAASYVIGSSGPTITSGSGVPSSTQPDGSLYIRRSTTTGNRIYVTSGGGTWAAVAGV